MLTRNDYEGIAEVLYYHFIRSKRSDVVLVKSLMDYFESTNERFDRDKFDKAVYQGYFYRSKRLESER